MKTNHLAGREASSVEGIERLVKAGWVREGNVWKDPKEPQVLPLTEAYEIQMEREKEGSHV